MIFPGGQDVSPRKAFKTMVGEKGWLEDTTASPDKKTPTPKKTSFKFFDSPLPSSFPSPCPCPYQF
jgi:hypothetical protein